MITKEFNKYLLDNGYKWQSDKAVLYTQSVAGCDWLKCEFIVIKADAKYTIETQVKENDYADTFRHMVELLKEDPSIL